jgi:rubrerythrin
MTDLIDRIELMRQIAEYGREIPKDQVIGVIARMEAVEVEGRPRGEWIAEEEYGDLWVCDQCGVASEYRDNFCPNCGSDNRGRSEDE